MILAYNYPILNLFWSMFIFFGFIIWIWVLVVVFIDIFRSPDLHGFGKALWFLFVLFIPLLGVIVYLIARGHKMQEHAAQAAQQQQEAFREQVQAAAGQGSSADQVAKLAQLRDSGALTADEFEREKAKVLGQA